MRIVSILFPLFAITALGYLVGRRYRPDLAEANRLNMEVFTPALVFAALLLQTTVAPNIRILGASPDFALIVVVAVALQRGALTGAAFGFLTGVLVGVALLEPLGMSINEFNELMPWHLDSMFVFKAELKAKINEMKKPQTME